MRFSFIKISPTHHRFECGEAGKAVASAELETKAFLFHDFLHYSVEAEAPIARGFYGLLAAGIPYAEFSAQAAAMRNSMQSAEAPGAAALDPRFAELAATEQIVGLLTGFAKGVAAPESTLAGAENMYGALCRPVPAFLTPDFFARLKERMRRIQGEWNATPFGKSLVLEFPPAKLS